MLPRCEPRFAYAQAIDSSQHDAVIESLGVCRVQLGIICPPTELVWGSTSVDWAVAHKRILGNGQSFNNYRDDPQAG